MATKIYYEIPVLPLRGRVMFPCTKQSVDVGRLASLIAVKQAGESNLNLYVAAQLDPEKEQVDEDNVSTVGVICSIRTVTKLPGNSLRMVIDGLFRASALKISQKDGMLVADVEEFPPVSGDEALVEAYFRTAKEIVKELFRDDIRLSKELSSLESCPDPYTFLNCACDLLKIDSTKKQSVLETPRLIDQLKLFSEILNGELEMSRLEKKINAIVRQNIDKGQKEYYLREQLKAIHTELGDDDNELDELEQKIKNCHMPKEVEEKALKELSRMGKMSTTSPDYNLLSIYLDWMISLPWTDEPCDKIDVNECKKILDEDHYGLDKIKERITEYLAVLELTGTLNAPILCFVGPPGVGKTSIATSIARCLNRKFVRMSLGGVKDESEIRGHRKTYIGAMPGRIIAGIKTAGAKNPVFLLDEIDKLASDMRGDPASALLEVLDPAQNSTFRDRYLEVPYDLSKVLFITTANSVDTIPRPLLDRMELIQINGYTEEEKKEIAKRYLISKRKTANGIKEEQLSFSNEAISEIISGYTLEAGVRNLERRIDAVCRKAALKFASGRTQNIKVTAKTIKSYLGARRYDRDLKPQKDEVGAACGLAWTAVGGTTLTIEVSAMHGKGDILLTGKLGDVMKESARAAISYIRSNSQTYGIDEGVFETTDIHIHVPEGATPKDGPSAGITMACAILSAFTGKPVKSSVAMTGEITLRGKVLPIGGLKEKALAAYRVGVTDVIIPADNQKDLEEIPQTVRGKLNFIPVSSVDAVFKNAIVGI